MAFRRTLAALLLAALLLPAGASALTPYSALPIQLVETRPVETRLGNPEVLDAATTWVEAIQGAKRTVDLEHFYLSHWPGEPTGPVLAALGAAAKRGVKVRLILDAGMHKTYPMPADSLGRLKNFEVRLIDMKDVSGSGVQHAKFFVIDDDQVIVGSQNLDWRALKHIHELGLRVRDARIAAPFARVFASDWAVAKPTPGAPAPAPAGAAVATPLPPLPVRIRQGDGDTVSVWASFSPIGHIPDGALSDRDVVVRLLDGAKRDVVVQLLTYGNGRAAERDTTIDAALRRAAARGVSVRMVVSDWEADNARIADLQALTAVPNIMVKLSTVPEWSGGYIPFARVEHCKYMVVDLKTTWVGTSNWEPSYFRTSRNAAITVEDPTLATQARQIFMASWDSPTARVLTPDMQVAKKTHGETPPEGKTAYGK